MSLRPQPARWFELLMAREDLTMAAETLANTHAVELEIHSQTTTPMTIPDLQGRMEEYNRLAQRYQQYWPESDLRAATIPGLPTRVIDNALDKLYAWREDVDPLIQRLESLRSEHAELALVEEMLVHHAGGSKLNLALMANAGPALASVLYVLPPHTRIAQVPADVISQHITTAVHKFFLALGPPNEITTLQQELSAVKGRHLSLPSWLHGGLDENHEQVAKRLGEIDQETQRLHREIEDFSEKHRLSTALNDITRLDWFLTNVSNLPISENFGWLTGWTSDLDGKAINDSLKRAGVRAVLHFPPPPTGVGPPLVLQNPWWAKPFELFAGLLGTPGSNEADPSRLLAIIAPLLFGYMFSDVGQGFVLFVVGLILQRRWPFLRLLIAGGLSAMVFGFVFGSVFSREDIISPLWLHPLEHPLPVLIVPMFGGVALLILGLLLNAVEAYWRGEVLTWGRVEAAVLTLYVGLVTSILHFMLGMSMAVAGLLWYVAGSFWESHTGGTSFPTAIAQLLDSVLQLAVNTISFARVGAFAMAHAGLSLAIVTIADVVGHPVAGFIVMVLGNILIIVLEGLVVSVQTTRLVLFEFFIRFLRGEGRVFRPLEPRSSRHA